MNRGRLVMKMWRLSSTPAPYPHPDPGQCQAHLRWAAPIPLLHPSALSAALASHDYILKIVPTVYEDKSGKQRYSYQYTVANKVRGHGGAQLRAIAPSAGRGQRCQVSGQDCHWFPSEVANLFWGTALAKLRPWVKMAGQSFSGSNGGSLTRR